MAFFENPTGPALARRVAGNTGVQIAAQAVGTVLSLIFLRLATGHLDPATFGELAIVLGVGGILIPLIDVGMTTTLARELAKTPDRADELGGAILRARLVSASGFIVLTLAVLPFLPYSRETKIALVIYLGAVTFTTLGSFQKAFFQVHLQLQRQAALDLLQKLLNIAAILVVIALALGLIELVAALVLIAMLVTICAFILSRPFWRPNLGFSWVTARPLLRDAVGIGVLMMVGLIHFRIDAILLSLLRPAEDVGVYTIAYRFVEQAYYLPGVLISAIFPILTRYLHRNDPRLGVAINRTFQFLCVGGLGVGLIVYTLARPLVNLIAGPAYDSAILPAQVLSLVLPILFLTPLFSSILIAVNRQGTLIKIGLIALVGNVAANLVLIPPYGPVGAAWATVGSEGFVFAAVYVLARATVNVRIDLSVLPRAMAATVAAIPCALVVGQISDLLASAVAVGMFIAVSLALGAIRTSDVRQILSRTP